MLRVIHDLGALNNWIGILRVIRRLVHLLRAWGGGLRPTS